MKKITFLLLAGCLSCLGSATAQDLAPVVNRSYQVKYMVPNDWQPTRHITDSLTLTHYLSPDRTMHLWVGQLRGTHSGLPPARALQRLLRHLGATHHREHNAIGHGLDYLESTGTCFVQGRELRYEARLAQHHGQMLVMYVYATPEEFNMQAPLLHQLLDSLTPVHHPVLGPRH
ncbi:hypothetical protein [Hymenobacter arizonensis]|uniref:DUF1795 domain-containing protein n=1 Tax=Hymenobacter arizonensis TaxID=1227077 RepID=A0A1I5WYV5_HYMAR|nr:hypothetical protein [Hymenobacter arizonensis]SFQ24746.1 hypothetical protein SAMN04515668_1555 [Hymenobacter arizonensis]